MKALQLTAQAEHTCSRCRKAINAGESMVRNEGRTSNCCETILTKRYYHLDCWKLKVLKVGK
jgi:hypothetical protein